MIYLDVWPGEGLVEVEKLVYCCCSIRESVGTVQGYLTVSDDHC